MSRLHSLDVIIFFSLIGAWFTICILLELLNNMQRCMKTIQVFISTLWTRPSGLIDLKMRLTLEKIKGYKCKDGLCDGTSLKIFRV